MSNVRFSPIYVYKAEENSLQILRANVNLSEIENSTKIVLSLENSNVVFDNSSFFVSEITDENIYVVISKRIELDVGRAFDNKYKQTKTLDFAFNQGIASFDVKDSSYSSYCDFSQVLDIYFVSSSLPKNQVIDFIMKKLCI